MGKLLLRLGLFCAAGMATPAIPMALVASAAPSVSAPAGARAVAGVTGQEIVQFAEKYVGYPYTATGNSPSTGFSCIGFVSYVYRSLGINLPGDLGGAYGSAPQIPFSALQPGDVLYFQNTVWTGLSHAAIYIGGGKLIHAEWYNRGVVITSFANDSVDGNYWPAHYLGANRPWAAPALSTTAPVRSTAPPAPTRVFRRQVVRPSAMVRVLGLNVRTGPSLRYSIETALGEGTRLSLLGHWNGWYHVALPRGGTGWVAGMGIGRGSVVSRRTVYRTTRVRVTRSFARSSGTLSVTAYGLRVRAAPSLGAGVIATVGLGQHLGYIGRYGGWVKAALPGGRVGWVSGQFVNVYGARTAYRATARNTRSSGVVFHSGSPGVAISHASLNVRLRPSLGASVVSIVPPGSSFQIVRRWGDWAWVRLAGGGGGWMSQSVLGYTSAGASAATTTRVPRATSTLRTSRSAATVTAGVRFHARPGIASPTIGLVAAGTHVQILSTAGAWAKVRLPSSQTGYVYGLYVSR